MFSTLILCNQLGYSKVIATMVDKIPWDTCIIALIFCVFIMEF